MAPNSTVDHFGGLIQNLLDDITELKEAKLKQEEINRDQNVRLHELETRLREQSFQAECEGNPKVQAARQARILLTALRNSPCSFDSIDTKFLRDYLRKLRERYGDFGDAVTTVYLRGSGWSFHQSSLDSINDIHILAELGVCLKHISRVVEESQELWEATTMRVAFESVYLVRWDHSLLLQPGMRNFGLPRSLDFVMPDGLAQIFFQMMRAAYVLKIQILTHAEPETYASWESLIDHRGFYQLKDKGDFGHLAHVPASHEFYMAVSTMPETSKYFTIDHSNVLPTARFTSPREVCGLLQDIRMIYTGFAVEVEKAVKTRQAIVERMVRSKSRKRGGNSSEVTEEHLMVELIKVKNRTRDVVLPTIEDLQKIRCFINFAQFLWKKLHSPSGSLRKQIHLSKMPPFNSPHQCTWLGFVDPEILLRGWDNAAWPVFNEGQDKIVQREG